MTLYYRISLLAAAALLPLAALAVEPGKPSATALEVAAYRAIGANHADPSLRNGDDLAEKFLGREERAILKEKQFEAVLKALEMDLESAWASLDPPKRGLSQFVHARTRHIDSLFEQSIDSGASQVVILGAGLDSRAYRYQDLLRGIGVFEVDFPPTQEYKKKRVREIFGSLPAHVTYVPIDFAKQELETVLIDAGYDRGKKTLFVWEGVTMYIPEDSVDATLRFVAENATPGSTIAFDYFYRSTLRAPDQVLEKRIEQVATIGEPIIFGIPNDDREGFITRRGLEVASDIDAKELGARYLAKSDGSVVGQLRSVGAICAATVPSRAR